MTFTRQTATARDTESLSSVVVAGIWMLAAAATFLPSVATPRCIFRLLTGIPCPTCGTYRAMRAMLYGRLGESLHLQPLLTVLALLSIAWVCHAALGARLGIRRVRIHCTRREVVLLAAAVVVSAVANWVHLIRAGI
jgi:hypothetical protein